MVAWVPLDRPDEAAAQLDRLEAGPGFAGIRTLIHDQPDPDWLLRPSVGAGLALFGPDRLMFGSDWPVAELGGGYVKVWTELSKLFAQLSPPERAAVLAGTATRFYALGTSTDATGPDGR